MQESGATADSDREGGGGVCREKLKIGEESLSGSASWSRFGYSSIHSKFLAHCLMDGKGRAPFGRARTFWKGMPLLEGHAQLCLIGEKGGAPFGRARTFWKGAPVPRRLFFAAPQRIAITLSPNYYQKMQRSITRKNQEEHGPEVK